MDNIPIQLGEKVQAGERGEAVCRGGGGGGESSVKPSIEPTCERLIDPPADIHPRHDEALRGGPRGGGGGGD